ncbi:MAG: flagellar biosynthetic protein FliO [Alkalispirochaeta sp.]
MPAPEASVPEASVPETSVPETSVPSAAIEDGSSALPSEEQYVFNDAQTASGDADAGAAGSLDTFGVWDLVRMVLVLLVVIGAIYGVIALLRRRVGTRLEEEDSPIRILASRNIGTNQEIHAVMIGRQVLILGGCESGLQLITRVEDQETIDELVLAHSVAPASVAKSKTFGTVLGKWLGNLAVPGTNSEKPGKTASVSFLRSQQDRLRSLK